MLMEGESLFNDATSIVLFEIFFSMVKRKQKGHPSTLGFLEQAAEILSKIAWLAFGAHGPVLVLTTFIQRHAVSSLFTLAALIEEVHQSRICQGESVLPCTSRT